LKNNDSPRNRPETSLERGMREVKETAQNLDKNIRMFKNGGSSRVSKESLHE
jgi:hypothetical protein